MNVTLYLPGEASPIRIDADGFTLSTTSHQITRVSKALDCSPGLVDVLATGPAYVIYTVFDSEAEVNYAGMIVTGQYTSMEFDPDDDDQVLRGPVLVVSA